MPIAPVDGQRETIVSTQNVTALTLAANTSQTLTGSVASLTANVPVSWVFNAPLQTWYPAAGAQTPLQETTYANLPTASANTGAVYVVTDVCSGALWYSTGTYWKPAGGSCILYANATGWTNTGLATNTEQNLISLALPPMLANDQIETVTLWTRGGTLTDTSAMLIRLSATGCTPQTACNSGTSLLNISVSSSAATTMQPYTRFSNANATNSQVAFNSLDSYGWGTDNAANATASVQTSSVSYLNIDSNTVTSSADSVTLNSIIVKLIRQ
jgi:hypothetical protein